ncbi:MAG: hypothetical protein IT523_02295 [Burkholderiales bacterium]|nr:hypothetical protein [Burkholderiales bacterium]
MKSQLIALGAAAIVALAIPTADAASGGHGWRGTNGYRPTAPAVRSGHVPASNFRPGYGPGHRPGYRPGYGPGYRPGYWRPGYWSGGRWIAPVFVAATIGGIAYAATAPGYAIPTVDYVPAPVVSYGVAPSAGFGYASPMAVDMTPLDGTDAADAMDAFDVADIDRTGCVTYEESAVYPHWQRNFGFIDRNHDGCLSRDEVAGWRTR